MGWYMPSFQVPEVFGEGSSKSRPGLLVVLSKYPPPSLQTVSVSLQGLGQVTVVTVIICAKSILHRK